MLIMLRNVSPHTSSTNFVVKLTSPQFLLKLQYPRPREVKVYSDEEQTKFTKAAKEKIETEVYEWDEGNEEALRIISFTVSDELQGPIHSGKTAKGAWDELQQFHAPNDKIRKIFPAQTSLQTRHDWFT